MEQNSKTLAQRWQEISTSPTFPRTIITVFVIFLCAVALVQGLPLPPLLSDSLVRFGMNIIFVLAMVPAIQSGIGPNFGLPIGIITGLLGSIIAFQYNFTGWGGFWASIGITLPLAIIVGILYGMMLNRVKGSEMIVSTYTGFAIVSLMSIGWILLPFDDARMAWPLGNGLRNVISLDGVYAQILNDTWSIKLLREKATGSLITLFGKTETFILQNYDTEIYEKVFSIPTAMLLFVAFICFLMWLYTRSKSGIMLKTVGENARFARSNGINVDYYRIVGATVSTVLGAIGIIVYSQSYGFMQLYQAPLMMGFPAVAGVLIGGASAKKANIMNVFLGALLFQTMMTTALPVANSVVPEGNLSESIRMIVQNGVILFALTQVGGNKS